MDINLAWKGDMSFEGAANSGYSLQMDTDKSVGGRNSAAQPMEFIALGLAGCTAMDVISILKKKHQQVENFEIKMQVQRTPVHPKVFTQAVIEYHVRGRELSEEALLRAIELSATTYCPAYAMLSRVFPIRLKYFIQDSGTDETISGEWRSPG